eukprot:Gregarina_sp_Poly_1__3693@NODE_2090_length_2702_cov_27_982543_g1349_i0_p1_GENE_NODE_2090_length_2702_cov_27_982543_g1349_i0NODE_2090_length_2702_cov_27_982543_g1349_i0_p1_ORF_typecomplete_len528_score41_57Sugar_tr/PF00083_24/1_2e45MFS_1/PF07690_16/2_4e02MFS_1/PF07690_16/7_3e18MFS_1/PF07690_16/5_5e07MFS_2/PF13347_6/0_0011MFS_2/PF13347_6/1_5MFS_2/PF13347_6/0_057MFS_4/PF06779_14/0_00055MFS_4/PF06779_14/1_2e02MFS_1_like/PF12832_7/0_0091MFS_1_like/PF12832_7/0_00094MFS_1_like/PF12832_7/3e02_NODE_2090_
MDKECQVEAVAPLQTETQHHSVEHSSAIRDLESNGSNAIQMTMDEILERIGTHRMQWMIIIISAFSYGHFSVQTMVPTLSVASLFEMWPDLAERSVYFNSVFAAGAFARLVGSLCLIPLLDQFGRRNFLIFCLVISIVTSCASALAPAFPVYVVLRALTLMFTSVLPAAATVYSVELVRTKTRALPSMLCQAVATMIVVYGTFTAAGVGGQRDDRHAWKWISMVSCAPAVIPCTLLALTWLETPRFLMAVKQDTPKAWKTLSRLSPGGSVELRTRLVGKGFETTEEELQSLIQIEGLGGQETAKSGNIVTKILHTLKGMWQILTRKDDFLLTYSLLLTWALQAFSHWGLSSYMTLFYSFIGVDVTWTTAASFLVQVPGQLILYFIMQSRLGRIGSIKIYAALCTVMHLMLSVLLGVGVSNRGGLTFTAMMCFFFGGPLWGPIYTYSAESYPTTIRSSAMALFTSTGAIATIITTYVGSISLDEQRTWTYPLIWGLLRFGIVLCALGWKFETKGARLLDHSPSNVDNR